MKQLLTQARNLPRRIQYSIILLVVLTSLVLYVQNAILSSPGHQSFAERVLGLQDASPQTLTTPVLGFISNRDSRRFDVGTVSPSGRPTPIPTPFFMFHTIEISDTLISVASKYGVTSEELLATNDIRDPDDLEVGQQLLIPPEDSLYEGKLIVHQAKKGDTVLSLASKYGSSVRAIRVVNRTLETDTVLPGETLAIPVLFDESNAVASRYADTEVTYHTVQSGEMPLSIAANYNVPVEVLLSANEIVDPTRLQIGQVLLIPPHEGITLGYPVVLYELAENDTLVGIASRFGSSVKDILAVNPDLDPGDLEVGQLVAVPVIFSLPQPTPVPRAPSAPRPTPGPPPSSLDSLEEQLIAKVNEYRIANGLAPYKADAELAQAALAHSQDMVVRGFLSHINPDGASLRDRLADLGIGRTVSAGENIQKNTRPRSQTVETAVNWFMNSRPHRHNLLHSKHNSIGVGVVEGPAGWFTYTLVFARR